ncbi:sugar-binding transcriptional regulator [Brevibacillus daliensis]|uniref:sugar-binding transcriptional regulator n=1 Tax=Brevibacillus daliensis TaxID=2892995 RepID=UPI0028151556|nr:sugar-binding transcriptional regulator [Brevibacillus daliensis]
MEENKINKMVEAAKMYYLLDNSQQDIALKLGVSRPTVSRLLQQAKEEGIVKIEIIDPEESIQQLEAALCAKYHLKHALVAPNASWDEQIIKVRIGKRAAQFLNDTVKEYDILAVTWGTTMYQIARGLQPKPLKGVKVVQLKGGVSHSETNTYASEVLHLFGQAFQTTPHYLPLPAIVDSALVKQTIEADRYIHRQLELAEQANFAIFTTGGLMSDALLFRLGYLSKEDVRIVTKKAVGDICSRFFDRNGDIVHQELNDRTIGIQLDELRKKEYSILVAGGKTKLESMKATMNGKYSNVLVTDQLTAKELLNSSL